MSITTISEARLNIVRSQEECKELDAHAVYPSHCDSFEATQRQEDWLHQPKDNCVLNDSPSS